jgi:hypothetical protein
MRRSLEHDVADSRQLRLENSRADIAASTVQILEALAVTPHQPASLWKVKPKDPRSIPSNPEPGPAGFDWPNE